MADEPLYLTDAERPIRPAEMRARYRFFSVFRLNKIQYTRWFPDVHTRAAYLQGLPGVQELNSGEETADTRLRLRSIISTSTT